MTSARAGAEATLAIALMDTLSPKRSGELQSVDTDLPARQVQYVIVDRLWSREVAQDKPAPACPDPKQCAQDSARSWSAGVQASSKNATVRLSGNPVAASPDVRHQELGASRDRVRAPRARRTASAACPSRADQWV
jgi:hypothetical protein